MEPLTVTVSTSPESGKSFTERYGGWILSACFHVALFSALLLTRQPRLAVHRSASEPIRVTLSESPAPAAGLALTGAATVAQGVASAIQSANPALTTPAAPLISVQPAQQLGKLPEPNPVPESQPEKPPDAPDSLVAAIKPLAMVALPRPGDLFTPLNEAAKSAGEGSGPFDPSLPFNPEAGGSTEPGPASPDGAYPQGTRSKRGAGVGGAGTGYGRAGGSAAVGERISVARADLIAKKTFETPKSLFSGRGASEGAVREIDLGGTPGDRAKAVLDRYGIKMLVSTADEARASGLMSKDAGQQQFVTKFGSGTIGVFRFSSIAANRMGQLEEEALRADGEDPEKIRVVYVVFGIVNSKNGYDLGVIDMRTEPLIAPPTRRYEKALPGPEPNPIRKIRR